MEVGGLRPGSFDVGVQGTFPTGAPDLPHFRRGEGAMRSERSGPDVSFCARRVPPVPSTAPIRYNHVRPGSELSSS